MTSQVGFHATWPEILKAVSTSFLGEVQPSAEEDGRRERAGIVPVIFVIAQFRYIKIQPKTIDLSTRLRGITTEFVGFIFRSLELRSIVLD